MEKFNFKLHAPARNTKNPSVRDINLGDGYVETVPNGLVRDYKTYRLTWTNLRPHEVVPIEAFLARHKGYLTFLWDDPLSGLEGRYKCRRWETTINQGVSNLIATFTQVAF